MWLFMLLEHVVGSTCGAQYLATQSARQKEIATLASGEGVSASAQSEIMRDPAVVAVKCSSEKQYTIHDTRGINLVGLLQYVLQRSHDASEIEDDGNIPLQQALYEQIKGRTGSQISTPYQEDISIPLRSHQAESTLRRDIEKMEEKVTQTAYPQVYKTSEQRLPEDSEELFFTNQAITGEEVSRIIQEIDKQSYKNIRLLLDQNEINDNDLKGIAESIVKGAQERNLKVEYLDLSHNNITKEGIPHIMKLIQACPQIKVRLRINLLSKEDLNDYDLSTAKIIV